MKMRCALTVVLAVAGVLGMTGPPSVASGQALSSAGLVSALRRGGHVVVLRHARSPSETPDAATANADNPKRERQLDATGRANATAMGTALRGLRIPVGDVLTSPTYRALETIRLAQLPSPQPIVELGDGGQSMQGVTDADAAWLRARVARLPTGTNTFIITHMPNLAKAFPEWGAVAEGEAVVLGRDDIGHIAPIGRIKIEDWPRLAR